MTAGPQNIKVLKRDCTNIFTSIYSIRGYRKQRITGTERNLSKLEVGWIVQVSGTSRERKIL